MALIRVQAAFFLVAMCTTAIADDTVWVSALDLGKAVQGYGHPQANAACDGGPISIRGRKFAKGFGTHAVSDLFVALNGAGRTFSAVVGIDDDAKGQGRVEFTVFGDGKRLWTSGPITGRDPAKPAEVDLRGVKTLQLHVGAEEIGWAHADWADAKITYAGPRPQTIPVPPAPIVGLPDGWQREQTLNAGWRFLRLDDIKATDKGFESPEFDDARWEEVTLPHTPRIERRDERYPFQGICWYRHRLPADPAWKGKRVSVQFGAAMQIAEVWLNGQRKVRHLGGYLPFTIDLTDNLRPDGPNVLAVRLDNRDTIECPPGTPTSGLDFNYPGGLYRGVRLVVTDPVHISDAVAAGVEAGGGVFVQCHDVSEAKATVSVKTHVVNELPQTLPECSVVCVLRDPRGKEVARSRSLPLAIAGPGSHTFRQDLAVVEPQLWHPDHPWLYTLDSEVLVPGRVADRVRTRVGIRTFALGKRLLINGREFRLCGSNRHQEYPWLEYAVSPNAAWRDAKKIREGGFNHIRLSHYPQDPAFLDACDELGLLVQAPIPGWQFYSPTASFVRQSFQDVRDLVRRDRNHPCVLFWEPNLNETNGRDFAQWQRAAHEIAHAELPGPECFTFGDPYPEKKGWFWDVQGFAREYGDFGFGGNESTSRHLRGEGEQAMLQQAWNYQWCYNDLSKGYDKPDGTWLGCATWVMFDYNRGYYHKPCTCGMMDILRLPKFVYHFYQSQRDPVMQRTDIASGPMIFLANYWTPRPSPCKVVVYSNCEEVELSLNGKPIRRQRPDHGPDTRYSSQKGFNYATVGGDHNASGGHPYDGGNCLHLVHPPFTFAEVPYEPGRLKATGYIAGKPAAVQEVRTPGKPAALKLAFDTAGRDLAADGADAIFVRGLVVDELGTVVPTAEAPVAWSVDGPGRLIGSNPGPAEAGVASVLLQAGLASGTITVKAAAAGLAPASAVIESRPASSGRSEVPLQ